MTSTVLVPPERVERWVENFGSRHGGAACAVEAGTLRGTAPDASIFVARLPFGVAYDDAAEPGAFADAARLAVPADWGVLLVRKGGFAVARLDGRTTTASKVGRRHVQGRTKAGGQSQQRFARRRSNQARQAYEAAADHAARVLEHLHGPVVVGGDRSALDEVLADPRLAGISVVGPWLPVPDPRRSVLDAAVVDATSAAVDVTNAAS